MTEAERMTINKGIKNQDRPLEECNEVKKKKESGKASNYFSIFKDLTVEKLNKTERMEKNC